VKYIVMFKKKYTILPDTNILARLVKRLDCESNLCEQLITKKLFCDCSLNADVIIPRETLKEMEKMKMCKERVEFCLLKYEKLTIIGGRRVKHKVSLVSYERSMDELKRKLKRDQFLKHFKNDCKKALEGIRDKVDKSLISITLVMASNYKSAGNSIVVLLTMDKGLFSTIRTLVSKAKLTSHAIIPDLSSNTLNKCMNADCLIKCILKVT